MLRYTQNLRVEGNKVWSYKTHVATISGGQLIVHGWWSRTTSKHINHVAKVYELKKVEGDREDAELQDKKDAELQDQKNGLKSVAMVAMMGNLFGETQKQKNDWKARMLKAGLGDHILMPEDWDKLSEKEKEKRLDGAIGELAK